MLLLGIAFNLVGLKHCTVGNMTCFFFSAKLLVVNEKTFREGITFLVVGWKPSVVSVKSLLVGVLPPEVGRVCKLWLELLMRPYRLLILTRCQGGAPLGASLTFADGIRYCRSNNIPMTSRNITPPMPLRVAIMTRESGAVPSC